MVGTLRFCPPYAINARRRCLKIESEAVELARCRHAIDPEHDGLGIVGRVAEPMRAAACEAKAVALLECPAFGIDGELHFALDDEARFLAVMGIAFVAGAAAGLHMDEKQIEAAVRSGWAEQLLGDAGAPARWRWRLTTASKAVLSSLAYFSAM